MAYCGSNVWKSGGTRPPGPQLIAPMWRTIIQNKGLDIIQLGCKAKENQETAENEKRGEELCLTFEPEFSLQIQKIAMQLCNKTKLISNTNRTLNYAASQSGRQTSIASR